MVSLRACFVLLAATLFATSGCGRSYHESATDSMDYAAEASGPGGATSATRACSVSDSEEGTGPG